MSVNLDQQLVRDDVLIVICLFCTHLTFDLIQRLRSIRLLGIHPYGWWHTSRNTISMDARFCSILPSNVKIGLFRLNGLPTINIYPNSSFVSGFAMPR